MQRIGNKPFPPYGAILNQYLKAKINLQHSPYVFVGKESWEAAKEMLSRGIPSICLPPNESPAAYTWPVKDLSLILFDTSGVSSVELKHLANYLMNEGARQVTIYSDGSPIIIVNRD